jgi:hypothetical protein
VAAAHCREWLEPPAKTAAGDGQQGRPASASVCAASPSPSRGGNGDRATGTCCRRCCCCCCCCNSTRPARANRNTQARSDKSLARLTNRTSSCVQASERARELYNERADGGGCGVGRWPSCVSRTFLFARVAPTRGTGASRPSAAKSDTLIERQQQRRLETPRQRQRCRRPARAGSSKHKARPLVRPSARLDKHQA